MDGNLAFVFSEDSSEEREENGKENSISSQNNENIKSENSVIENVPPLDKELVIYASRWGVLFAAFVLNMSNGAMWTNTSPVATDMANYYDKAPEDINWFSLLFLIFAIPGAFYGTYVVDRWGLKPSLWTGALLNVIGALIRALSTSSVFTDDRHTQFAISLTGQLLCAIAQNFIIFMATKISQCWFPDNQRGISTTVMSIANPTGAVVAQIAVPFIVESADDVPLNDLIFLGISIVSAGLVFILVRRSTPPTTPSYSADDLKENRPPYLEQLKIAFTCRAFWLLLMAIGAGIALAVSFATLTQQMLCPLGYTEVFSGLVNGLMLFFGFGGAVASGVALDRTKMYTEITIYLFGAAAISAIILLEFFLVPDQEAMILLFAILFGIFGVGLLSPGLELAVEATYPAEESITSAFIYLSGQLMGIVLILMIPALAFDKADLTLSICSTDGEYTPKDYTLSVTVTLVLLGLMSSIPIAFFKTDYKRQKAELERQKILAENKILSERNSSF